jgi:hypothetical protein
MSQRSPLVKLIGSISLAVLLFVGALAQPSHAMAAHGLEQPAPSASTPSRALILLTPDADVDSVAAAIEQTGAHVTHIFPPSALIAEMPSGKSSPAGVLAIYRDAVSDSDLATLTSDARRAALVWNALLAPETPGATGESLDTLEAELVGDAMVAPAPQTMQALDSDLTPGYTETSEYMIGRVAVGIVLPESDSSVDSSTEDWSEDERALVLSEITTALDWWASLEPNAHLTFVYEDGTAAPVPTSYEPISRRYSDQSLWVTEVMDSMGYTGYSYFDQVRHYNNALRDRYDTDWAFTIFVVDSSNDSDNRFSDGYFAYAYLGGPFCVLTYGNNGYGSYNMDAVAAHEMGHIFWALDQYYSAHQPCTRKSGYLSVENQNSQYGSCALDEPSIMRGQTWPFHNGAADDYARGQIGWRDSDGDGILDPVDTTLSVTSSDHEAKAEHPNILTFTGSVQDDPYPSPIRRSTIINTIQQVQYRVADGEWLDAEPTDGAFDTYAEGFTFTTPPLPTGELDVELRVLDSAGNELIQSVATVSVIDPVDAILNTTLMRLAPQDSDEQPSEFTYNGQSISATSHIAAVYFRVDGGDWQAVPAADGAFDQSQEEFTFIVDIAALDPGNHQIEAYSRDGEGNIETSPANDCFVVESHSQYVFLPFVNISY